MLTIEQELRKITGVRRKRGETRSASYEQLALATDALSDDVWETLSEPAQEWSNAAMVVIGTQDPIPTPRRKSMQDLEETTKPETKSGNPSSKPKAKSTKPAVKKKKVVTKSAAPKAKKVKAKKPARPVSMRKTLRRLVVKKPMISIDDLSDALSKSGFKPSRLTVSSMRGSVRDTMKIMKEEGMIDVDL